MARITTWVSVIYMRQPLFYVNAGGKSNARRVYMVDRKNMMPEIVCVEDNMECFRITREEFDTLVAEYLRRIGERPL